MPQRSAPITGSGSRSSTVTLVSCRCSQTGSTRWAGIYRALSSAVTVDALVGMRLNALVVDLAVLGPGSWEYLERVCSRLPGLAVIVCTGPSSVAQRVRGLRLGADAWMTKPCHAEELICVIEAAIRRHRRNEMPQMEDATSVGEIMIRPGPLPGVRALTSSLELTAREFEILHLLSQSDRVLRREEIYERVWGYAMAHGDRSVDVFVRKLRQKLRVASPAWSYIHTHFGVGYRFAPEFDSGESRRDRCRRARRAEFSRLADSPAVSARRLKRADRLTAALASLADRGPVGTVAGRSQGVYGCSRGGNAPWPRC